MKKRLKYWSLAFLVFVLAVFFADKAFREESRNQISGEKEEEEEREPGYDNPGEYLKDW